MELLPLNVRVTLPPLYAQDGAADPIVYIKYFHPLSHWTWYALEGSLEGDDFIFFGWANGDFPELGYFSLNEMESVSVFGIGIERDLNFTPMPLSEVKKLHERGDDDNPTVVIYIV